MLKGKLTKGRLTKFFSAAAIAASAVLAGGCDLGPRRPLTDGESTLTRTFFGSAYNAGAIRLAMRDRPKDSIVHATTYGNAIYFYGDRQHEEDYSRTKKAEPFGTFMHEITHTWQIQSDFKNTSHRCHHKYNYTHMRHKKLTSYCTEEQAAMVEDYARRFLMPGGAPSFWQIYYNGKDTPGHDEKLKRIIETQFHGAKTLRLQMQGAQPR